MSSVLTVRRRVNSSNHCDDVRKDGRHVLLERYSIVVVVRITCESNRVRPEVRQLLKYVVLRLVNLLYDLTVMAGGPRCRG